MLHKIVTLPGSHDRQNHMKAEMRKLNLTPCFHFGIQGNKLSKTELDNAVIEPNILRAGEIGCALSHLQLYRQMLKDDIPYMMILEDDIIIENSFPKVLPEITRFVQSHLQGTAAVLHLKKQYQYLSKVHAITNEIGIYETQYAIGTPGYIITKEAAANILKIQTPLRWEIDIWKFYYYIGAVKIFAPNISLIQTPEDFPSTINAMEKRVRNHRSTINRKLRFLSYLLSQANGHQRLLFYLFCNLRKLYTRVNEKTICWY